MAYLERIKVRPTLDDLTPGEARFVQTHFDAYAGEVVIHGQAIRWADIDEVEVVKAARAGGPAGWIVRYLVHGNERYHAGLYFGSEEAILPNVTLNVARFVVQSVAFYAPQPVRYIGPEGLSPTVEKR